MADERCNLYELNQAFLDALEFMDDVIKDRSHKERRLFVDLIRRTSYPLGEGLVRKQHMFHGGLGDQAALTTWRNIQVSRPASGSDPGWDSCRYESEIIDYAFETVNYTGYETSRRTRDICLNDIKWKWEFRQQLNLIFGFLSDITLSIWENFARETYLRYAADQNQIYILTDGSPDGTPLITPGGMTAPYNPFVNDEITITRDLDVSTLDWSFMDWWYQFLSLQVPMGNVGNQDGMPVYGLVIHPKDLDYMIRHNSDIREDFRYHAPRVLIDQYGSVTSYKGFSIIPDMRQPRFRVKAGGVGASTLTLERVLPYTTEATTIGSKPHIDPEYVNAEYAMGMIFIKDVFQVRVPPAGPASPGGGTNFGVVPSLMGEFKWLNIQDRCENPLNEKGYYFSRYQAFTQPLENYDEAICFLYKRCPQTEVVLCSPCDGGTSGARTITAAEEIIGEGESAGAVTQVRITLDACLDCEAPAELSVAYAGDGADDAQPVLVQDANAPEYVIAFETAGDWVAGGTIVAGTSTIVCS